MSAAAPYVVLGRFVDGIEVDTMMQQETGVLARHDRHRHVGRHLIERNPMVMDGEVAILHTADEHQWCDIDWNKPIGDNREDG